MENEALHDQPKSPKHLKGKILAIVSLLVIFIAVLYLVRLVTTPRDTRERASQSTRLYFEPATSVASPIQKKKNETFSLRLMIDPGTAQVSFVRFAVLYDQTKMTVEDITSIVFNTTAFPVVFEGPYLNPGSVHAIVSIGNDPTKAVTTPTQIATITFKALAATTGPIQIRHGDPSMVLSVGASESASQNVLGLLDPAYIKIDDDDNITPSVSPANQTQFGLTVFLHGLGNSGDNANPNSHSLSTKNPLHKDRAILLEIFNNNDELVASGSGTIYYASTSGNFKGVVEFGNKIQSSADYIIKLKSDQYLRNAYPGIQSVTAGTTMELPNISLVTGDVNDDNKLNILDYNFLYGCYQTDIFPTARSCDAVKKRATDLNDEGNVNMYDINLFIRELSVQPGL